MIEAIGGTPTVRLRGDGCAAYAKLELMNPFGMKDRAARHMILEARRRGALRKGAPIIESSSGTLALGVGLVGIALGHEVHIVTDPRIDPLTLAKLEALGVTVHVVEKMTGHGWQSARLERLEELLAEKPDAFWPRQYENEDNPAAYVGLAEELRREVGAVDVLVAGVGSGGSLCGTARELRRDNPELRVIGVDAVGSRIFGQPDRPKRLQSGLGNSLVPANVDPEVIDEVHWLADGEAFAATHLLAREQQIFAGNSSGSVYAVTRWLRRTCPAGTRIAAILPDRGDRYLWTFFDRDYLARHSLTDAHLPDEPRLLEPGETAESWSRVPLAAERSEDARG